MASVATARRRVDFLNNRKDMTVAVLGAMGYSTWFIIGQTGYTEGQVVYRLHKAGIRRADYRNGVGRYAGAVRRAAMDQVASLVSKDIT